MLQCYKVTKLHSFDSVAKTGGEHLTAPFSARFIVVFDKTYYPAHESVIFDPPGLLCLHNNNHPE